MPSPLLGGHGRAEVGDEVSSIAQHPVQHDRKLAGQSHLRLAHPCTPGDGEGPGLQVRASHAVGQNDVRRFVERRADTRVADLGDAARIVRLPGLNRLGVKPKWAPTILEDRNLSGSSTAETKVKETRTPTPGTVISRRARSS